MPETNGIDAASQIREDFPIPVILVSAYQNSELVERAKEANKPVERDRDKDRLGARHPPG